MTEHQKLTRLPEWSAFFRAALLEHRLHFRWHEEDGGWIARAYRLSVEIDRPTEPIVISESRAPEKFDALRLCLSGCGETFKPVVWESFYVFRAAATGAGANIEDLL